MWRDRLWWRASLSVIVALLVAGPALAVDVDIDVNKGKDSAKADVKANKTEFKPNVTRGSQLIGMGVQNTKGDNLGSVDDLVLTANHDRLQFAVVSVGGFLGIGAKEVAVPWQALKMHATEKRLVLDADKEKLNNAKPFDTDDWPDMTRNQWINQTYEYWGLKVEVRAEGNGAEADRQAFNMRRVSKLIGTDAKNKQGDSVGTVEDVVIDMQEGRPVFCVLSYGGVLGVGENLAALPWAKVEVRPQLDVVRVDATKATLDAIAFKSDKWPDLSDREYVARIYAQFGEDPYWERFGYVRGATTHRGLNTNGWQHDSDYLKLYSKDNETTISGTIESTGTFKPVERSVDGLRIRVKTDNGTVTVHAGPIPYVLDQKVNLYYGDKITVTGGKATFNGNSVVLAREVVKGEQTLKVRDAEGKPLWDIKRLSDYVQDFNKKHGVGESGKMEGHEGHDNK